MEKPTHSLYTEHVLVKHSITIQDGGINNNLVYLVLCSLNICTAGYNCCDASLCSHHNCFCAPFLTVLDLPFTHPPQLFHLPPSPKINYIALQNALFYMGLAQGQTFYTKQQLTRVKYSLFLFFFLMCKIFIVL